MNNGALAIKKLKKEKNAIILAHYYQMPEIKEIADDVGDSYYLSKMAMEAKENLIVFCGVRFMAESAKILSPQKKVLLPAPDAGCPMADMAVAERVTELKEKHPDAAVVCYINSPVEVKALCDVCVTSGNAVTIISNLPQSKIIFLPDQNLSSYVASKCPNKEFIIYPGYCVVHNKIVPEDIRELKENWPGALVAAHPECRKEVLALADFVGSTAAMLDFVGSAESDEWIIVTEEGLRYELEKQYPSKKFYFPQRYPMICQNMKKTSIENVLWALEDESGEILIEEEIRQKALVCLDRMHKLAAGKQKLALPH